MKKTILTSMLLALPLMAEINLNDRNTIDAIGLSTLDAHMTELNEYKDNLSIWYLKNYNEPKFKKVRNDEFELDDAKIEAFTFLTNKIKNAEKFIGQTSTVRVSIGFKQYDFKNQNFPIDGMSKNSHLTYYGDIITERMTLDFQNIKDEKNVLPMTKENAQVFIKQRKNSNGYVNRDLTGVYTYKIKSIDTKLTREPYDCTIDSYSCSSDELTNISVHADIINFEIQDSEGTTLYSYEQY